MFIFQNPIVKDLGNFVDEMKIEILIICRIQLQNRDKGNIHWIFSQDPLTHHIKEVQ
jgi:hypothetical protein